MSAEELFNKYADNWLKASPLGVVPIIGSGLNIQARKNDGKDKILNWDSLLKDIIVASGVPASKFPEKFPTSFIRKWETILRIVTINTRGYKPYLIERDFQKKVQKILKKYEEESVNYDLYKRFIDCGFQDIISLNFDRSLSLVGKTKSVSMLSDEKSKDGVTLYRHSSIETKQNNLRVWYPHGDTKRLDTIKLGVRKYGTYINWIEGLRGGYMNRWYEESGIYEMRYGGSWIPPNEWDKIVRTWENPSSWVNIFKSAPLLFIGCSLLPDEWPLWFLLNQRARQTAFLDQRGSTDNRPETIILTAGKEKPNHLLHNPEYLINIHFENHDKMWESVIGFLEKGKRINNK